MKKTSSEMQINCIHLHDQHLASCHWMENLQPKKEVCSALFSVFGEVPSYIPSDNCNDYCRKFETASLKLAVPIHSLFRGWMIIRLASHNLIRIWSCSLEAERLHIILTIPRPSHFSKQYEEWKSKCRNKPFQYNLTLLNIHLYQIKVSYQQVTILVLEWVAHIL